MSEAEKAWDDFYAFSGFSKYQGSDGLRLAKLSFEKGFVAGQKSGHKNGVAEGINLGEKHERERILKIIENRIYLIEPMDSFDRVDNAVCIARENELTELKKQIEGQKGSEGGK